GKTCPWPRLKRGTISLNTASEAAISTIKGWVEECFDSHEPCQQIRQKPQLPTRVVEIIDATTIRLREDCHEKGIYTCLSHCWGKKSFIRTTTASLAAHCDTISWDDLPTTFQDTIDITRRLGVRYIWIDSLCIIQQDDLEDWRHEGSKMCDIYSGSYLTIAASRSEDSTGGCYSIADTIQETPQWFTNANNEQYSVNMRLSIQHELETSPLIQRAWFFQERVLSPRVVHFGPDELYWECRVGNTCECSDWRYVEESEYLPTRLGRRFETDKPYPTQSGLWHFVVRQYTRKKLQYETDIFPALQGVAKSLQHYGDYYAGLWRSETLLLDLLWCSWDHSRPAVCRAPSWSWASVTGRVYWYNYPQDFELLAEVVSIQTIPLGSDPFGQLLSGQLELKGPCFTGRI
ncbi:heterokaryon incompatibility protein-domain-containing protein, partial [Boeremia exigua]|uniref:heterokaryon incompatibility protein-domain-containing protein n=1 Tax=Boeremia exigua TaxID=749465 RepID=UPI001E8DE993